jgi:two-component system nitrate/nitrite response regulator NarL
VHVLLATDADYVIDEVTAALGGTDVSFTVCRNGRDVSPVIAQRQPDLAVLDLQIGSMGAMAVTMALRLDESASGSERTKVLMLLDRQADIHLAKRCDADGWLVKPMNPLALRRAVNAIVHPPATVTEQTVTGDADAADDSEPTDVTA